MRRFLICTAAVGLLAGLAAMPASAKEVVLWSGWMNLTPCSKWVTDNGFPYAKWGSQELHGAIVGSIPDNIQQEVQGKLANCAATAVGVAGVTGLLTNAAAVWPTFMSTFGSCAKEAAAGFGQELFNSTRLDTHTECHY